ncbi:MAG TPA: DUF881 domain-containing protein [Actinomycetales bacterium]|nr:DUF881 domain-containing protein [Actinomycetales bacterium]
MTAAPRRDASMTLLAEVMQRPLDPGYAAAAEARRAGGAATGRRRVPLTIALAVVAGAIAAAAVLDLRLPGLVDQHDLLTTQVEQRTAEAESLQQRLEGLRVEISGLQDAALVGSGAGSVDQARRLALLAGSAAAVGPGVEITLDDASITDAPVPGEGGGEADDDSGRVLARDVVTVVNGLWAAGAEAVAVNDHRLTSLAAIRAAGDAILVDFRALVPPYRITAIGDPQDLQIAFATSAAGTYLAGIEQNFGVQVSISGRSELEMPGDQGLRLRYARPPGPTGVAPNDAPTPPPTDQEVSP